MMARKIPALGFQSEETRKPRLLAAALRDDGSFVDRIKKYSEEDNDKLLLLCRHYGIQASPFMFYELALALAREIYPEPKKRGRKSKWTFLNKGVLVVEVERRMRQDKPGYGVAWACSKLAKIEPWASFLEKKEGVTLNPDPAEALRQIYFDFRGDDWAEISRKKFREYKREGAIAKWEEQVSDLVRNPHPK